MPTHTWPPPGVRLSWRDGGEVVKRPLKRTEGGGHWPNNWLTLFLGPQGLQFPSAWVCPGALCRRGWSPLCR